jgi:PAS domain S-box-containing protein
LKPLRVLLVEDSRPDAELVLHELITAGYDVTSVRVETADDMRTALEMHVWDIVLSDYTLPAFSAPRALAILHDSGLDLPFLIVSGTIGEETAVAALKAGASDFLVKGRLSRLVPAIERELREAQSRRERRAVEEQLRQTQARSAYALDAAGAGIWDVDLSSGSIRWTERISQIFGLPPEPVETDLDEFRERVHPDDRAMIETALAQSIETDAAYRVEFRIQCPDGTIRWVSSKGRVSRNANGAAVGSMGISIDVTERKRLERQLQHAQKLECLGQFAGSIAHDFNNVLSVIVGFSELMLDDLPPDDRHAQDLAEIRKAGHGGKRLTQQLLAFRVRAGISTTNQRRGVIV